jgi:hypothetical protein
MSGLAEKFRFAAAAYPQHLAVEQSGFGFTGGDESRRL